MQENRQERENRFRFEICSVSDRSMDIEPEDNDENTVFCLKRKHLKSKEYWLDDIAFNYTGTFHKGIRIHKVGVQGHQRSNFVEMFPKIDCFTPEQIQYIADVLAYVVEHVTPSQHDIVQGLRQHTIKAYQKYFFNYITTKADRQIHEHFYIVDGFIKFEGQSLNAHIKACFDIYREGIKFDKDVHFYLYDSQLTCFTRHLRNESPVVDMLADPRELARTILFSMIPHEYIFKNEGKLIDIENVEYFYKNLGQFKQLIEIIDV